MNVLSLHDLTREFEIVSRIGATAILYSDTPNPLTFEVTERIAPLDLPIGSKVKLPISVVKTNTPEVLYTGAIIPLEFEIPGNLTLAPLLEWNGEATFEFEAEDWEEGFTSELEIATGYGTLTYNVKFKPNAYLNEIGLNYNYVEVSCTVVNGVITAIKYVEQGKAVAVLNYADVPNQSPVELVFNTVEQLSEKLTTVGLSVTPQLLYATTPSLRATPGEFDAELVCKLVINNPGKVIEIGSVSCSALEILPVLDLSIAVGSSEIIFNQRMRSGPIGALLVSFARRVVAGAAANEDDVIVTKATPCNLALSIVDCLHRTFVRDPEMREWGERCRAIVLVSNYQNVPTLLAAQRELETLGVEVSFHCVHNRYMDNLVAVSVANTLKDNGGDVICTPVLYGIDYYPPRSFAFILEE